MNTNVISMITREAYVAPDVDDQEYAELEITAPDPIVTHYAVTTENVHKLRRLINKEKRGRLDVGYQAWTIFHPAYEYECPEEGHVVVNEREAVLTRFPASSSWSQPGDFDEGTYSTGYENGRYAECRYDYRRGVWYPMHPDSMPAMCLENNQHKNRISFFIGIDGKKYYTDPPLRAVS